MRTAGFAAWGRRVTRGLGPLALAAIALAPACRGDGATATGDADTSAGDLPTTGGASGPTVSTETTAIEPGSSTGTSTTGTAGTTGVGAEATSSGNAEATADTTAGTSSSGSTGATTETSGDAESTAATLLLDPPPPHFTDVTDDAGVWYVQGVVQQAPHCLIDQLGPGNFGFCVPEREIAGAAVADIDGDDDLDLFVTRTNGSNLLFANDGAGTFLEVSAARGLTEVGHSSGAAFGDVDNDGDADLFVATVASYAHRLYINDGTGHFVEDALARGAAIDTGELHIGTTPTFGDFDLDGYLDLY
ncbi:MAG: VCBS repeat-containing protein, partial [Myxococcales bacterium]|nr:VCBS repeat-containing protein [Myxococcales bacterium]